MPYAKHLPVTPDYLMGSGVLKLTEIVAGVRRGTRDAGNVTSFAINSTNEKFEHKTSRTAQRTTDFSRFTGRTYAVSFVSEQFDESNFELVLAANRVKVTQAADSVVAEVIPNAEAGREYRLGVTNTNPRGVRNVSSVAVRLAQLAAAATRVDSTPYTVGQLYKSGTNVFIVTAAGTSAGSAPSFDTAAVGNSTTDGGATVKFIGVTTAYTVDTTYYLSDGFGMVGILASGTMGLACALYTEVTGNLLSLSVDYTKAAAFWWEIGAGTGEQLEYELVFVPDNTNGTDRDVLIPLCTIAANGDTGFITDDGSISSMTFDVAPKELNTGVPLVLVAGRPA